MFSLTAATITASAIMSLLLALALVRLLLQAVCPPFLGRH